VGIDLPSPCSSAWSPDGSRIAFILKQDDNPEIYVMNSDDSNPLRITQNTSIEQSPTWKL